MHADKYILKRMRRFRRVHIKAFKKFVRSGARTRDIYARAISMHQSALSRRGRALEDAIAGVLRRAHVPFMRQGCVRDGYIVKPARGVHRHDFIIGGAIGEEIANKCIISCKVSLRERFLQDAHVPCKKLFMVTLDTKALKYRDDYSKQYSIDIIVVGGPVHCNVKSCVRFCKK